MRRSILLLLLLVLAGCGGDASEVSEGDGGIFSSPQPGCSPADAILAGVDGVSNPELIPASKVEPVYPDAARLAGIEGAAILQAVIGTDGTVCDIQVLNEHPTGWEFVVASIEALEQWRYDPAMKDGRPVTAIFTVFFEYKLN